MWDKFIEEQAKLKLFLEGDSRCYKSWLGSPAQNPNLKPVLDFLVRSEFYGLEHRHYFMAELNPNGGRWTNQIVTLMCDSGLPTHLQYHIVGTKHEADIIGRDVFGPKFGHSSFCYAYPYRIRSGNRHVLISEVACFHHPSERMEIRLNRSVPFRLIVCMDTFTYLPDQVFDHVVTDVVGWLGQGGMFFFNVHHESLPAITKSLSSNGLVSVFNHQWRDTVYIGARHFEPNHPFLGTVR